ncbi:diguanylate cyclase domain-containing protein [Vibrio sp. 10N.261.51.F12]|uniref:diguanylate cyclase domain-containing protein n=1 Tax=Vibrio sp. 10N.261.51.F12 TaxID=3229679 RepID=UPI00354FC952
MTPIPTIVSDRDGKLEYVNSALLNLLGYTLEEISRPEIVITHQSDIALNTKIRIELEQDPAKPIEVSKRYIHKDGHTIYAILCIVAHQDTHGVTTQFVAQIRDLSRERQSQAGEVLLEQLVLKSNDAIYVVDPLTGQILNCNELAYKRLGYSKLELLRLTVPDINPLFDASASWEEHVVKMKLAKNQFIEATHRRKDGSEIPVEASVNLVEYNNVDYLLAIVRDISERKAREIKVIEAQNLDPLTNLPNRRLLESRLQQMTVDNQNYGQSVAFLYLDVDNFKIINDKHGHAIGDQILVELAQRIHDFTRQSDIIARLGGDEFLVVMRGIKNRPHAESISEHLLQVFSHPFKIQGCEDLNVNMSIGVTLCKASQWDSSDAIAIADRAMYQAKTYVGSATYFMDYQ